MNWLLSVLGVTSEVGRWYAFWSGSGADIGELAIVGALIQVARRMVKHHREHLAQQAAHHEELKDHLTAAALAGRRPLMSEAEFERNLAEMMPDLNCFTCGYSGTPRGHQARHEAYLAALKAQRENAAEPPATADLDAMAAEYKRQGR